MSELGVMDHGSITLMIALEEGVVDRVLMHVSARGVGGQAVTLGALCFSLSEICLVGDPEQEPLVCVAEETQMQRTQVPHEAAPRFPGGTEIAQS